MKRFGMVLASVLMLFVFSAVICAEDGGQGAPMEHGGMMMPGGMDGGFMMGPKMILAMASELNLTTDQMDKLKKIGDETPAKGEAKEGVDKDMEAFKAEMQNDTPDETKIDALIDKMASNRVTTMKNRLKTALATRAILTKDQREILKKKMEEKKDGWKKRAEKMKDAKDK